MPLGLKKGLPIQYIVDNYKIGGQRLSAYVFKPYKSPLKNDKFIHRGGLFITDFTITNYINFINACIIEMDKTALLNS